VLTLDPAVALNSSPRWLNLSAIAGHHYLLEGQHWGRDVSR
jgi:hypothetical protein